MTARDARQFRTLLCTQTSNHDTHTHTHTIAETFTRDCHVWFSFDISSCSSSDEVRAAGDAGSDAPAGHTTVKRRPLADGLGVPSAGDMDLSISFSRAEGLSFRLCSEFVGKEGRERKPAFGFNGLGELVYQRTYARYLGEDTDDREEW